MILMGEAEAIKYGDLFARSRFVAVHLSPQMKTKLQIKYKLNKN